MSKYHPSPPVGHVYLATNIINGKQYVGQTINSLLSRWTAHKTASRRGSSIPFHQAIKKYGDQSFRVASLAPAWSLEELSELEIAYISGLSTLTPNGYNRDSGGKNYSTHPETRAKIGAANKGRPNSRKGKTHTIEARLKMSAALKGRPNWWKGKKRSAEQKANLSAMKKGKSGHPHTQEFKDRLSERNKGNSYMLGRTQSPEHIKKRIENSMQTKRARGLVKCLVTT